MKNPIKGPKTQIMCADRQGHREARMAREGSRKNLSQPKDHLTLASPKPSWVIIFSSTLSPIARTKTRQEEVRSL